MAGDYQSNIASASAAKSNQSTLKNATQPSQKALRLGQQQISTDGNFHIMLQTKHRRAQKVSLPATTVPLDVEGEWNGPGRARPRAGGGEEAGRP